MLKNNNSISDRVIEEYQKEYEESVTRLSDAVKKSLVLNHLSLAPKVNSGILYFLILKIEDSNY